jgi:ectoine hydroxylase-related dioxygenase (phytanoyl-CoA dioxygenase family)
MMRLHYRHHSHHSPADGVLWPFSKSRNCSIWVALDDADPGNGCVEFFAGSHQLGGLHALQRPGSRVEDSGVIEGRVLEALRGRCPLVECPVRAGWGSVHSDLTAHLSMGPNPSGRRRLGVTISFCPTNAGARGYVIWP